MRYFLLMFLILLLFFFTPLHHCVNKLSNHIANKLHQLGTDAPVIHYSHHGQVIVDPATGKFHSKYHYRKQIHKFNPPPTYEQIFNHHVRKYGTH